MGFLHKCFVLGTLFSYLKYFIGRFNLFIKSKSEGRVLTINVPDLRQVCLFNVISRTMQWITYFITWRNKTLTNAIDVCFE